MKFYHFMQIVLILFFIGCAEKSLNFGNPILEKNKEVSYSNEFEYYLNFEINKGRSSSDAIKYKEFCEDTDRFLSKDKYVSLTYLELRLEKKKILSKAPIWSYSCTDSITGEKMIQQNMGRIVIKNNDDTKILFYYENSTNNKLNENVDKLVNSIITLSGSKTIVAITDFAPDLKNSINDFNSSKLNTHTSPQKISINTFKVTLPIHAQIDKKTGSFLNLDLLIKLKKTLINVDTNPLNGYPNFKSFNNSEISLLHLNSDFTIGKEEIGSNQRIIDRINSFNFIPNISLLTELSEFDLILKSKQFNKIDRLLLTYLAFKNSLLYREIKEIPDIIDVNSLVQIRNALNILEDQNNILFSNMNLLKKLNLNKYYEIIEKIRAKIDKYNEYTRIQREYQNILNEYENIENARDVLNTTFNNYRTMGIPKSSFNNIVIKKRFSQNEEIIQIEEFNKFYNEILKGEVSYHGCYIKLQKTNSNPRDLATLNQYLDNTLRIQEMMIPQLTDLYSYMILQHNNNSNLTQLLLFRGKMIGGRFMINKLLIDRFNIQSRINDFKRVIERHGSEDCRNGFAQYILN